jgi:hypothetical protein
MPWCNSLGNVEQVISRLSAQQHISIRMSAIRMAVDPGSPLLYEYNEYPQDHGLLIAFIHVQTSAQTPAYKCMFLMQIAT